MFKLNQTRKKRLYFVAAILIGVCSAVGLSLYALGQNISLYYTPSQLLSSHVPDGKLIRLGGIVKKDSLHRVQDTLKVSFVLTDYHHTCEVKFKGILPALFREGQGIVVQGKLNKQGLLIADQVLAKHDNKYMPPGIKKSTLPSFPFSRE